jgi:PhnB protein
MQLSPYLTFAGDCAEAFRFYERCFRGTIELMQTHGESPMAAQSPPDWHAMILHVSLRIGQDRLLASDRPPGSVETPRGFAACFSLEDPTEAERLFAELAEGGTTQMAMQQTFWAERFGMCTDRFGTPWIINGGTTAPAA